MGAERDKELDVTTPTCDVCGSDIGDAAGTTCPVCGADLATTAPPDTVDANADAPTEAGDGPVDASDDGRPEAGSDDEAPWPAAPPPPARHDAPPRAAPPPPPGASAPPPPGASAPPPPGASALPAAGPGAPPPPHGAAGSYQRATEDPYHPSGLAQWVRTWGMLTHLSAFLGAMVFLAFSGPLVMWLMRREEHPFFDHHGKEALNFNLSMLLYLVVGVVTFAITVGLGLIIVAPLGLALAVTWLVAPIMAAVKASNGEGFRYPVTIRFIAD